MEIISEISRRVQKTRSELEDNKLEALLITNPKNLFYFTGVNTGRALIRDDEAVLWVKEVYRDLHSKLYSSGGYEFEVRIYEEDALKKFINNSGVRRLGIENVSVGEFKRLSEGVGKELIPCSIPETLRAVKSRYEIKLLKKSADMAKEGMRKACETVREGVNELDAVAEIEYEIRKLGSETPPFCEGMLLASGASGADIHAFAEMKRICSNSLVVVDLGARYKGYYSDMTRTLTVGRLDEMRRELLEFTENLELETADLVEVGAKASDIHRFVEGKIEKKGYRFYHSTGHGVGLDVHETPNIGSKSDDVLEEGMVFTIEPGIYIPRKFGIRFEDMILLRRNKTELLTR
jgi:Xaa-Pro dipeptidase